MPEQTYQTHDGVVNRGTFDRWIMSAKGVKRVFSEMYPNLDACAVYTFKDAVVRIDESGSWRDGAPVSITVQSDKKRTLDDICSTLEKRFFGGRS